MKWRIWKSDWDWSHLSLELLKFAQKTRFSPNGYFHLCELDIAKNLGKSYQSLTIKLQRYNFLQGLGVNLTLLLLNQKHHFAIHFFLNAQFVTGLGITSKDREVSVVLSVGNDNFPTLAF